MASVLPQRTQFVLDESRIPRAWYNIAADLPAPQSPPLHPGTHQPIGPADLAPLFPMALILQEVSGEREIEIPDPVREAYMLYRPSPLHRAHRLEKALDTPAHIYYKYEGVSPAGSHKPNTAIPQAFFNKQEGVKRLATETGAGQWGSALVVRGRDVRARGQGLHGPRELRPEAVPPDPHGDVRRPGRGEPQPRDELRPRRPGRDAGLAGLAGHGDLGGGRGRRDARRHEVLAGLGPQPRAPAPDGRGPRGARADGDGRRGAGRDHRLRRRRLELRGAHVPVRRPQAARRGRATGSSPRSPRRRRR